MVAAVSYPQHLNTQQRTSSTSRGLQTIYLHIRKGEKCVECQPDQFFLFHIFYARQVDKHRLVAELGINYRDVRILDPLVGLFVLSSLSAPVLPTCRLLARWPCPGPTSLFTLEGVAPVLPTCCLTARWRCAATRSPTPKPTCCAQVPTPTPSTVFIRDKAILVNLESLRMIVCSDKVGFASKHADIPAHCALPLAGPHGNCRGRTAAAVVAAACAGALLVPARCVQIRI